MAQSLRIMGVHGVGNHHDDLSWQDEWKDAISAGLLRWNPQLKLEFHFPLYDDIFSAEQITAAQSAAAIAKLLGSGIVHGIGGLFHRRSRGLFDLPDRIRWTAGMVVQWTESEPLRRQLRQMICDEIKAFQPDIIAAHSLGSLVSYDTFIHERKLADMAGRTFISFGSQIGNPFVRSSFGGRLVTPGAQRWFHLFNSEDDVMTSPIRVADENFEQVETFFDIEGVADHAAESYLAHDNTIAGVYRQLAGSVRSLRMIKPAEQAFKSLTRRPRRRALLVGINEYPDEANRLEGCVNDVFLMSSVLQEIGFQPEEIRVVLDDRATARGIRHRLDWLLDETRAGDQRVFFYSGHGAQISGYGVKDEVDRIDECLVPHDFDWSPERAVLDDELYELYSQLPYESQFYMFLDCCHSGGMARGSRKIRGLNPPDDIRHRDLRWNAALEMWEAREFKSPNRSFDKDKVAGRAYVGSSGATRRLGRAVDLRTLPNAEYDRVRKQLNHEGPYLPTIFQACQEGEVAEEYRHGVTSYGAFTYSLCAILRAHRRAKRKIGFAALVKETEERLHSLGFPQTPQLLGAKAVITRPIQWFAGAK